jgi:hypothetical protein
MLLRLVLGLANPVVSVIHLPLTPGSAGQDRCSWAVRVAFCIRGMLQKENGPVGRQVAESDSSCCAWLGIGTQIQVFNSYPIACVLVLARSTTPTP